MKAEFYEVGQAKEKQMELVKSGLLDTFIWDKWLLDSDVSPQQTRDIAEVLSEEVSVKNQVVVKFKNFEIADRWDARIIVQGKASEVPDAAQISSKVTQIKADRPQGVN